MMFLQICCFDRCTGISFIDSTSIPVCHNKRIYRNKILGIMLPETKAHWVGILDLNCTLSVMNEGKFSTLCVPKPM